MDNYGQVHIEQAEDDWLEDINSIAHMLADGHVASFRYAALASGHQIMMVPRQTLRVYGQGPQGTISLSGGDNEYTYVSIETWRNGHAWLMNGAFHHPSYIAEKIGGTADNPIDAVAIAYLLNSIEQARGADLQPELDKLREHLLEHGEKVGVSG